LNLNLILFFKNYIFFNKNIFLIVLLLIAFLFIFCLDLAFFDSENGSLSNQTLQTSIAIQTPSIWKRIKGFLYDYGPLIIVGTIIIISVWMISEEFASSGGNKINEPDLVDRFDEINGDDENLPPVENGHRELNIPNLIANRTESED
jgi:hypothetical protein